jgi:hypothetical protein
MSEPEQQDPPERPLDAERARLRNEGYTEAEISQILINRATLTPPAGGRATTGTTKRRSAAASDGTVAIAAVSPSPVTAQGVLSSITSSLVAIGHYAGRCAFFDQDRFCRHARLQANGFPSRVMPLESNDPGAHAKFLNIQEC